MKAKARSKDDALLGGGGRGRGAGNHIRPGRLSALRSKGVTGSLKMDAVVNEDYGRGCKEKRKDKYTVGVI